MAQNRKFDFANKTGFLPEKFATKFLHAKKTERKCCSKFIRLSIGEQMTGLVDDVTDNLQYYFGLK